MTDQTTTPEDDGRDVEVAVHLDVLAPNEAQVRQVLVGPGVAPTIVLGLDLTDDDRLSITATIPGSLADDLEAVELLRVVAKSFHEAVEKARPSFVERLIQPTAPTGQVPLDGLEPRA